jgi:deoxyadenosine/deoxycytidine kinase
MAIPAITCVDGLISSGKSTVIREFRTKHSECYYVDEPLEEFTYFKTHNGTEISPLDLTYHDSHNSTAFQLYVLEVFDEKLKKVKLECTGKQVNIISDRCLLSAHVFRKTLQIRGFIPSFSWEYWLKKFHEIKDKHLFSIPKQIFFLNTDVRTCLERMSLRGRDMEVLYKDMENYQNILLESYKEILPLYNIPIIQSKECTIEGRVTELEAVVFSK